MIGPISPTSFESTDVGSPSVLARPRRQPRRSQHGGGFTMQKFFTEPLTSLEPEKPNPLPRNIEPLPEGKKIYDLFSWTQVLQETGDGGKVVVCHPKGSRPSYELDEHRATDYILKIRSKESLLRQRNEENFRMVALRMLNLPAHQNIVPYHEVLEDEKFYYMVMEKASGGALFSSLLRDYTDGVVPESAVKRFIRDTLEALRHAHRNGLLHRDVKPDNLVVRKPNGPENIRRIALIDWDHADPSWVSGGPERSENGYFGTLEFCAPEALTGRFSEASDLYSVGVTLYLLMTGKNPYPDQMFEELRKKERTRSAEVTMLQRMSTATIDWQCDPWPHQPDCKEFCMRLLAFQPEHRMVSAQQALKHRWLHEMGSK